MQADAGGARKIVKPPSSNVGVDFDAFASGPDNTTIGTIGATGRCAQRTVE